MAEKNYTINFQKEYKYPSILFQSLTQQVIDMAGVDVYYLPKKEYQEGEVDLVFQELCKKEYTRVKRMRMYVTSTSIYSEGEASVFTQFGLTLNDQIKLVITQKEFYERTVDNSVEIDASKGRYEWEGNQIDYTSVMPTIDDLIFVDQFGGKLFKITSVSEANSQYQKFNMGTAWSIIADMWEASSNDKISVTPDVQASDDTKEFVSIINGIDTDIKSTDLTEEDVQNANDTGHDVGTGIYGKDNLNDNYRKESTGTVRNTDRENPLK